MMNSVSLKMLLDKKQTKLNSFDLQKKAVEVKLKSLNSEASTAEITVGDKKMLLSEAVVTLSNFTIPDVLDEPDRASFTSVDSETGEELFHFDLALNASSPLNVSSSRRNLPYRDYTRQLQTMLSKLKASCADVNSELYSGLFIRPAIEIIYDMERLI